MPTSSHKMLLLGPKHRASFLTLSIPFIEVLKSDDFFLKKEKNSLSIMSPQKKKLIVN